MFAIHDGLSLGGVLGLSLVFLVGAAGICIVVTKLVWEGCRSPTYRSKALSPSSGFYDGSDGPLFDNYHRHGSHDWHDGGISDTGGGDHGGGDFGGGDCGGGDCGGCGD